jgi:hypothetical protein
MLAADRRNRLSFKGRRRGLGDLSEIPDVPADDGNECPPH